MAMLILARNVFSITRAVRSIPWDDARRLGAGEVYRKELTTGKS
jgi:hypothetical protein